MSSSPWSSFRVSVPHKPDLPGERSRIEAAGATVEQLPNGPARINGAIATSRALGDFEFKQNKALEPKDQAISAEPDIHVYELNANEDEILLLACDGVWDVTTLSACAVT